MNELTDGLMLMLIGMGTVFCFLTLLVFCVTFASKLINRFWPELLPHEERNDDTVSPAVLAVITSAIHQYRKKRQ